LHQFHFFNCSILIAGRYRLLALKVPLNPNNLIPQKLSGDRNRSVADGLKAGVKMITHRHTLTNRAMVEIDANETFFHAQVDGTTRRPRYLHSLRIVS